MVLNKYLVKRFKIKLRAIFNVVKLENSTNESRIETCWYFIQSQPGKIMSNVLEIDVTPSGDFQIYEKTNKAM